MEADSAMDALNIRQVATAQRWMVWGLLMWPIGFFPPAVFVTIPYQLFCAYRLAKAIKLATTATVIVLALILAPVVCLLAMLWLNHKAIQTLHANGVPVGLLGARLQDIPDP